MTDKPLPVPQTKMTSKMFVSPTNQRHIDKKQIFKMFDSVTFTIPAMKDFHSILNFGGHQFKNAPYVSYCVICNDELCDLSHYIYSISNNCVDIILSNTAAADRNITINYTVKG